MPAGFLIGVGSGLASALLFYSAARGGVLPGSLLFVLTPLPTLLAGFGWGWLPAAAGALAGALAVAFAASVAVAAGYALALGLPAVLATYLAYLSRPDPQHPDLREWYPPGRLLAALAIYAGLLPVLLLPLIGGSYEPLGAPLAAFYQRLSEVAPELGWRGLEKEEIAGLAALTVRLLPGLLAAYWLAIFTLNCYLAARIVHASGRLGRDWPDLPMLNAPAGFPLLVAGALGLACLPGVPSIAGSSFAGGLLFAHLLAGLALLHCIARQRARWILLFVYAGLLIFGPYAAIAITIGGLFEPVFQLKRRLGALPPPT